LALVLDKFHVANENSSIGIYGTTPLRENDPLTLWNNPANSPAEHFGDWRSGALRSRWLVFDLNAGGDAMVRNGVIIQYADPKKVDRNHDSLVNMMNRHLAVSVALTPQGAPAPIAGLQALGSQVQITSGALSVSLPERGAVRVEGMSAAAGRTGSAHAPAGARATGRSSTEEDSGISVEE